MIIIIHWNARPRVQGIEFFSLYKLLKNENSEHLEPNKNMFDSQIVLIKHQNTLQSYCTSLTKQIMVT